IKAANRIMKVKDRVLYLTDLTNSSSFLIFVIANKYRNKDKTNRLTFSKLADIISKPKAEIKVAIDPT
ncbi:MAG: hypothetical protein KGY70_15075, partial [Bacteroidales bacterium]|nr:hypothetical protein [Bacteroidales bacterium]